MAREIDLRQMIEDATYTDANSALQSLVKLADLDAGSRAEIAMQAAELVRAIRAKANPGLMEVFLAEYGLSTDEGIALMCLAEALLRVPDVQTIDALIEDKIAPSNWGHHLGRSTSSLVNASTWALMLTGKVLNGEKPSPVKQLRSALKRLGEPVIRAATARAMKEMGRQFVLGEDIGKAMRRAAGMEEKGYTYSYDMLGEAARTDSDAKRYHLSYSRAISAIATACHHDDIRENPGISVKLSALHPRYEFAQRSRVIAELVPRLKSLALLAKSAGMGLNIDAEEADRLALSLDVIEAVLSDDALAGWDGFGVVVQAYGPRAAPVLDYLYDLAERVDRRIMVRLVKGAYWDSEVKQAQVDGMARFPVFTQKAATDISYIGNARKLLGMTDRIYPQFATHNAHTVAAVLHMSKDNKVFEFHRLHGMGEALHEIVMAGNHTRGQTRCRIYAPVGAHRDLLAYLVRRLLENGANSSFVNQIVDHDVAPETVVRDPFDTINDTAAPLPTGPDLFAPERINSDGFDLAHGPTLAKIDGARAPYLDHQWHACPVVAGKITKADVKNVANPANPQDQVGTIVNAGKEAVKVALGVAAPWNIAASERAVVLNRAADLYEENFGELFALLAREAGKTLPDAVAELREAVDFLRFYAARAPEGAEVGVFTCISPWNFPLAIFSGQIGAALAAGNAVLAKPAEQTPLIAFRAVELLHEAGVPRAVLQLLPGGGDVGAALTSDARIGGVAFTGSTATALKIRKNMADFIAPGAPFIAETGGLNAMIVDSTALPEQAIGDIVESAFQSAGQRCSALRCLYLQEDIAEDFTKMLCGAMDELALGNPWALRTDSGPVIDAAARSGIEAHIDLARRDGRLVHQIKAPEQGIFVGPALIRLDSIADLEREVFGPVLHLVTFKAADLDAVIDAINDTGYGLTLGLQTRIDDRVQHVSERIKAGNIYVNRNQIGAVVGSQPFGGEGLSGTGPKAGGPQYLLRFSKVEREFTDREWAGEMADPQGEVERAEGVNSCNIEILPGPTGELNQLTTVARPPLLCLGPGQAAAQEQSRIVQDLGGAAICATGDITSENIEKLQGFSGVIYWGDEARAREIERALARRTGPIIPLITGLPDKSRTHLERHLCVDTTAAGGNAALLGAMD
ncbi:MAG: bifunctional proline dehydrogenase/L-glutamate gamma-semialdehyde dehydrogenase PutA [Rhodobacterales bacterium]|nr:bifunctional proline dehydrogenase/L-glutamate gamma-semialdehyde dehydrogenase PutA [Rhodobacterales bacterium]